MKTHPAKKIWDIGTPHYQSADRREEETWLFPHEVKTAQRRTFGRPRAELSLRTELEYAEILIRQQGYI